MYSIHPKVENENVFFIIRWKLTIQKSMHFAEYFFDFAKYRTKFSLNYWKSSFPDDSGSSSVQSEQNDVDQQNLFTVIRFNDEKTKMGKENSLPFNGVIGHENSNNSAKT